MLIESFLYFYQNIPSKIDPIAFGVDYFSIGWYPLSYLAAFLTVYFLLTWRIKKGEISSLISIKKDLIVDFLLTSVWGVIIGGRLGYVLFYNLPYYWENPWKIISPYDFLTGQWTGIYGMSYHGGLIGVVAASWIFCRSKKINFWLWADFVIPAVPLGYFFGRIGNFLNGELYGRITQKPWGMFFDNEKILRHPSQLYEAFWEGIVIFLILWSIRNRTFFKKRLIFVYLFLYSFFRFLVEFWREPNEQIGLFWGALTLGQILSLAMGLVSLIGLSCFSKKGIIINKNLNKK